MKEGLDINPERWPDVSRVFSAAATLDGPSRHAYLDEACRQDPALRAAVESLLGAHDNAGSFGETPVFAPLGTVKRLAPGSQLGPFGSRAGSARAAWARSIARTTLSSSVRSRSRYCPILRAGSQPTRPFRGGGACARRAESSARRGHLRPGGERGVAALVLELVEGPTLAERLAVGPLAFDEVIWIARQLAEGLEAAHERGIVHRDLKPANIKITPDGNVKILDFGLAKMAGSPPGAALTPSTTSPRDATQFGVVLGTVGYMSPEQARGQAVDKRTDIWAFGCVLFEMCAHESPFAGRRSATHRPQ